MQKYIAHFTLHMHLARTVVYATVHSETTDTNRNNPNPPKESSQIPIGNPSTPYWIDTYSSRLKRL